MTELAGRLDGLLFFPVTAFDAGGGLNVDAYRRHLRERLAFGPAAVFAACGTGEFFSLGLDEYATCVTIAVEEAAGRVPVIAGVGYGLPLATAFADAAAEAGADGLLAMPPYLTIGSQPGLRAYYRALADHTELDVIIYQRDNVVFTPDTVVDLAGHPRIVGFKDGHGDLDLMRRIVGAVRQSGQELLYFNGMPTAEMTAQAYGAVGVPRYSSAVFCFAPDLAMAFWTAFANGDPGAGDPETADRLLDRFWRPYVELRQKGVGYAVSLVKAGVTLAGTDVGPVRAPLSPPTPAHLDELAKLIAAGRALLS
jgi:5-dehydro-4-deoxyglucarate dehydratase